MLLGILITSPPVVVTLAVIGLFWYDTPISPPVDNCIFSKSVPLFGVKRVKLFCKTNL